MKELIKRIYYSTLIVIVYELGKHIILPGNLVKSYKSPDLMNSISLLIGGDLSRLSFFSLGVGSYMSGMIFWRVIQSLNKDRFSKSSENTIYYLRSILILFISIVQSLGLATSMKNNISFSTNDVVNILIATMVFTTGSMFSMWLVDFNMRKGIGGPGLLILIGILAKLPELAWSFAQESLIEYPTVDSVVTFVVAIIGIILLIRIMSFLLGSEYRIPVQRIMIRNELAVPTYIPIKVLPSNAMPYMFGLTFLMVPQLLLPVLQKATTIFNNLDISNLTSLNTFSSIFTYLLILIILGYGFAFVNVNPSEISEDLQKSGDYVVGIFPGDKTREYVTHKLMDMATVGNVIMIILLGLPLILSLQWPQLNSFSYVFGSILILNSTIVTITDQAKALLEKERYPNILPN